MRMPVDRLTSYTTAVIAAGGGLVLASLPSLAAVPAAWFVVLLAAEIAASLYKVNIALPGGDATLTLGVAVGFASLLILGPAPTVLIVDEVEIAHQSHPTRFRPARLAEKSEQSALAATRELE